MNPTYTFPKRNPGERARCARFVADQIARLSPEKDFVVEIRPKTKDRTSPQNRYLHAMFGEIARASGHTPDEVKEALVRKFLGAECGEFGGAEQGLVLPLPEEFYR